MIGDRALRLAALALSLNSFVYAGNRGTLAPAYPIITSLPHRPFAVSFSPDGKALLEHYWNSLVLVRDWPSGRVRFSVRAEAPANASFSPAGDRILIVDGTGVATYDAGSGERLQRIWKLQMLSAVFSPDGSKIVSSLHYQWPMIFELTSGERLASLETKEYWKVCNPIFSKDGTRILSAGGDNTFSIWSASTGKRLKIIRGTQKAIYHVSESPDGSKWMTVSGCSLRRTDCDHSAQIWDARSLSPLFRLEHSRMIYSAAFSRDGGTIITASGDKTAVLWSARTGRKLKVLRGHRDAVRSASLSPDGQWAATAGDDGALIFWELRPAKEAAEQIENFLKKPAALPGAYAGDEDAQERFKLRWE